MARSKIELAAFPKVINGAEFHYPGTKIEQVNEGILLPIKRLVVSGAGNSPALHLVFGVFKN
ncbi:hypothetical protein BTA51_17385 [Hahella sp. CCB-MM4]|nr:hypothetical protein BTA51_17385 [Hahella sp. CCB-MM4]